MGLIHRPNFVPRVSEIFVSVWGQNKQKVGNFLLPLVATRQVRQGGYLHKNIFDVQHLHQSKGRKYFIR